MLRVQSVCLICTETDSAGNATYLLHSNRHLDLLHMAVNVPLKSGQINRLPDLARHGMVVAIALPLQYASDEPSSYLMQ